jgi:hypothetical protein
LEELDALPGELKDSPAELGKPSCKLEKRNTCNAIFKERKKILSLHLFFHQKHGSGFSKYRSESLICIDVFLKSISERKMFILPSLKLWLVNTT